MTTFTTRLERYLTSWYCTSSTYQMNEGMRVELTLEQFMGLFSKRQIKALEKAISENRLRYFQKAENPTAYVLTWKSYAACSTMVFSVETATITTRRRSKQLCVPKKGDKLRDSHKAAISEALTGLEKSEAHKANLSLSLSGKPKKEWTAERRAARSELRLKQQADKRAETI